MPADNGGMIVLGNSALTMFAVSFDKVLKRHTLDAVLRSEAVLQRVAKFGHSGQPAQGDR